MVSAPVAGARSAASDAGQPGVPVSWPNRSATLPRCSAMRGTASSASAAGSVPDGSTAPGTARLPGGPEGEPVRQFGDRLRRLVTTGERADRVAGADDAVRGARHDAGQQPRPPGDQHVPPGRLGDLPFEVDGPVADAPAVAERLAPARIGDRVARRGHLVEPAEVRVDPALDLVVVAAADEHLDGHRAVVGQLILAPLRSGAAEPLVRLVQNIVRHDRPPVTGLPVPTVAGSGFRGASGRIRGFRRVRIGWHAWHDLTGGCPTNCDP